MAAAPPPTEGLGQRLVRTLTRARTGPEAGEAVLAEVAQTFGSQLGILWLLDPRTGLLRWHSDWTADGGLGVVRRINARLTFAPGVGLPGRVLETVETGWVEDIAQDPEFPRADAALGAGLRRVIAAPLVSSDGLMGVIEFFGREPRAPIPGEADLLGLAGEQLGAFLGRLAVEDRLRSTREEGASIVQAALDCIVTMDHRGRVIDFNPAAEATFGYERDATVGELLSDLLIPEEFRDAHQQALARYVETGEATILGRRLELLGMRSDGSLLPVELTVTRLGTREPPVFAGFIRDLTGQRDAEAQLATLLEREQSARVRAEEAERATREVAEALQRTLLPPHLPAIDGLELGAAYRAGTTGTLVGGDFYDVFGLGPGRWAIAIGDVCGKGPQAASLTGMLRYVIRHAAVREDAPSDVLRVASDELLREGNGDFCSAVFATMDLTEGAPQVCVAVAGHPLPLLARADGTVEPAGRFGALLGAVDDPQIETVPFTLGPGDTVLLYTDGLTEARVPGGRFGEARLRDLMAEHAGLGPRHLVETIDAVVHQAGGMASADDVAMLAVRAAPGDQRS